MSLKYGFFDSVDGDRKYSASDIGEYFLKLISNGVFVTPANAMQVKATATPSMGINVSAGWAFINCKYLHNTAAYPLTITTADQAYPRIDRVVMQMNPALDTRACSIYVKAGQASASPTAPSLTRVSGGTWELSLAQIYVAAGATAITQANITDERANTSVCGYVTGLIDQIDTTDLFAQYDAAFDAKEQEIQDWFESVREEIYTATNTVRKYSRTAATSGTNTISMSIGIAAYSANDILNVYVNGIRLCEDTEYTVSGSTVNFVNALDVDGTPVTFEVIKSIDSTDVTTALDYVETRLNGVSLSLMSQTDYEALPNKNPTTLYIVTSSGQVVLYLGETELKSGSVTAGVASIAAVGTSGSAQGEITQ